MSRLVDHYKNSVFKETWTRRYNEIVSHTYSRLIYERDQQPSQQGAIVANVNPTYGDIRLLLLAPELLRAICTIGLSLREKNAYWLAAAIASIVERKDPINDCRRWNFRLVHGANWLKLSCMRLVTAPGINTFVKEWDCFPRVICNNGGEFYTRWWVINALPRLHRVACYILDDIEAGKVLSRNTEDAITSCVYSLGLENLDKYPMAHNLQLSQVWY